jgi:hypothetical protein
MAKRILTLDHADIKPSEFQNNFLRQIRVDLHNLTKLHFLRA